MSGNGPLPFAEIETLIRARLATLHPAKIELIDDSAKHAGHAGARSGGHYRLRIVCDAFSGKPSLARHRLVHGALGELMHTRIHALSIEAKTSEEAANHANSQR